MHGSSIPPGFSHGKKVGWQNEYPPGWDKKSETEQGEWRKAIKKGRDIISTDAREKGLSVEEAGFASDDFEKAVRIGLDPKEAEDLVRDIIRKGKKGEELSVLATEEIETLLKEKGKKHKGPGKDKSKDKDKGKNKNKGKKK